MYNPEQQGERYIAEASEVTQRSPGVYECIITYRGNTYTVIAGSSKGPFSISQSSLMRCPSFSDIDPDIKDAVRKAFLVISDNNLDSKDQ